MNSQLIQAFQSRRSLARTRARRATCSATRFIVQGQPQRPILPILAGDTPTPVYSVTLSDVGGQNAFVFTADSDLGPGSAVAGAGIKGIHLVTPGVTNPPAGEYEIEVIAQTGPGGTCLLYTSDAADE